MGKAPGRTLQELRTRGEVSFDPQGKPFRSVAIAAHQFLCASHPRNLLHRDLNLNNIMYDPATEEVTIVDTGEALRLRRRGKTEEEVKNKEASNPPTTTKYTGTPWFMAPSVIHEREYGSEVDEASTALILLSLISEDDFEKFSTTRFGPRELERQTLTDLSFGTEDPTNFLNIYLNSVGPTSATAVALAAQPQLREVIDLAFRASAPGPAGEAAFAAFRDHPYFR